MQNVDPIRQIIAHMRKPAVKLITSQMPPIITRPRDQPYPSHLREAEINALRIDEYRQRAAYLRDPDELARRAVRGLRVLSTLRRRCALIKQRDAGVNVVARRRIGGAR